MRLRLAARIVSMLTAPMVAQAALASPGAAASPRACGPQQVPWLNPRALGRKVSRAARGAWNSTMRLWPRASRRCKLLETRWSRTQVETAPAQWHGTTLQESYRAPPTRPLQYREFLWKQTINRVKKTSSKSMAVQPRAVGSKSRVGSPEEGRRKADSALAVRGSLC